MRPTEPRLDFPARAPGSVRRVMYLDYDWIDFVDVHVTGEARDEVTDDLGATAVVTSRRCDFETEG